MKFLFKLIIAIGSLAFVVIAVIFEMLANHKPTEENYPKTGDIGYLIDVGALDD